MLTLLGIFVGVDWLQSILSCAYMEERGYCCLYCEQGSPEPQVKYNQQFPRFFYIEPPLRGRVANKTIPPMKQE